MEWSPWRARRCHLFQAVEAGKLTAVAEEISRTHKLSTCLVRIGDERGELVALFKGVRLHKGTPLRHSAG